MTRTEDKLKESLQNLSGKTVLDIGCGSGLHSLAAARLGASRVVSFDYDHQCVACSSAMKQRYAPNSPWTIRQGSVLDSDFLRPLGSFDIVYSWGVLPFTGAMWQAIENAALLSRDKLLISIYADQGSISRIWRVLKKTTALIRSSENPSCFSRLLPFGVRNC
ncbi:MAG: class I SAM-dependent methyltransferase [Candidatus Angelobacter sp.]